MRGNRKMTEKTITKPKIKTKISLKEPSMFKVIYQNDNKTTYQFVIESAMEYFNYSADAASDMAQKVNEIGSAVVAVLPLELAEQKAMEVTVAARSQGFPFNVQIKEDK